MAAGNLAYVRLACLESMDPEANRRERHADDGISKKEVRYDKQKRAWIGHNLHGKNKLFKVNPEADDGTYAQVAAGEFHTVMLQRDGKVRAVGDNEEGQ